MLFKDGSNVYNPLEQLINEMSVVKWRGSDSTAFYIMLRKCFNTSCYIKVMILQGFCQVYTDSRVGIRFYADEYDDYQTLAIPIVSILLPSLLLLLSLLELELELEIELEQTEYL